MYVFCKYCIDYCWHLEKCNESFVVKLILKHCITLAEACLKNNGKAKTNEMEDAISKTLKCAPNQRGGIKYKVSHLTLMSSIMDSILSFNTRYLQSGCISKLITKSAFPSAQDYQILSTANYNLHPSCLIRQVLPLGIFIHMKYLDKINSSLRKLISPSTCLK